MLAPGFSLARLVRWLVVSTVLGGGIMTLAGDWTSQYLWTFTLGISGVLLFASVSVLDDDLAQERFRPPVPGADAAALRVIRACALVAVVLAPLDSGRLHWGGRVPGLLRTAGILMSVGGFWLVAYSMKANRFFSPVIRIQDERGHRVVDRGPYALIRHPGYLGMAFFAPSAVLALGSWWALIPAGLFSALILRRVVAEDRFLNANLPGYDHYAGRVRSRIIPGVW